MTTKMWNLISQSNYLIDYESRQYIVLDSNKDPEEIYMQLCEEYELPYLLDVENFEDWANANYTACEALKVGRCDMEEDYHKKVIEPAIEDIFTDSQYFAWL